MAYSLLCSHTDSDLPSVKCRSEQWSSSSKFPISKSSTSSKINSNRLKVSKNNCKYNSDISLALPSTSSVDPEIFSYSSCPGSLYSDSSDFNALNFSEDVLCFQSRDLWPSCPGDVCTRCQDSAVTINNRCVCLCQTADCPHKNLRLKHYFPFDELYRPSVDLQGYRLLGNMYNSATEDDTACSAEGIFRFNYEDSSSSDDDTSSSETTSSSSYSSKTTSSSSSSTSTELNTDLNPKYS